MKRSPEVVRLGSEIRSRLALLNPPSTPAVRTIRREFSRRIAGIAPETVIQLAFHLLDENSESLRFFSYELVSKHRSAWKQLTADQLVKLGSELDSWSSVDCFAMYLSGPMWAQGRLSDQIIATWARSEDRWWKRAALVSTVALSRRGDPGDLRRVTHTCALLAADRDDMVVKALSWALREMARKHPEPVRAFLSAQHPALAARVMREVNNKLETGLKTPPLSRLRLSVRKG